MRLADKVELMEFLVMELMWECGDVGVWESLQAYSRIEGVLEVQHLISERGVGREI